MESTGGRWKRLSLGVEGDVAWHGCGTRTAVTVQIVHLVCGRCSGSGTLQSGNRTFSLFLAFQIFSFGLLWGQVSVKVDLRFCGILVKLTETLLGHRNEISSSLFGIQRNKQSLGRSFANSTTFTFIEPWLDAQMIFTEIA